VEVLAASIFTSNPRIVSYFRELVAFYMGTVGLARVWAKQQEKVGVLIGHVTCHIQEKKQTSKEGELNDGRKMNRWRGKVHRPVLFPFFI
jgi:hypothetical protein